MNEFDALYAMVLNRQSNPEEGSYTNYLLDKGVEKICKKVGEEATEVVIAACSQSKEDVINETSDLVYHLFVLLVEKGISLEEIEAELNRRSQKEHNLKPQRRPIENL